MPTDETWPKNDGPLSDQKVLEVIFRELHKVKSGLPEVIELTTEFSDLGLDSLDLIEYIAHMEQAFRVQISDDEWKGLSTPELVLNYVQGCQ